MSKKCSFACGLVIGACAGLLFAPKKGSETRADLKATFDDCIAKAKDIKLENVKATVENKINDIKQQLSELDKEKVVAIAKEKAQLLKQKCEDLVAYAKEKGTPVIEKTCAEVKEKTVSAAKAVVEKLETK